MSYNFWFYISVFVVILLLIMLVVNAYAVYNFATAASINKGRIPTVADTWAANNTKMKYVLCTNLIVILVNVSLLWLSR